MPPHDFSCSLSYRVRTASLAAVVFFSPLLGTPGAAEESSPAPLGETLVREAAGYGWRAWMRRRVYRPSDDERYGLQLADDWDESDAERPVIVLVHGFNSTPARNAAVLDPLHEAGFASAGFAYPNDHSIGQSAARLSLVLKAFAEAHPQRRVVLVTHSMGGLVARACVEDPALDPGNVDRLIQIAPPTHGTMLAHVAVATDVWEHWLGRTSGKPWTRWRDSVVDGLGEAADDLVPGSPFLTELNARPRNPNVEYAILLGTAASVSEDEMRWMRTALLATSGRVPGLRGASDRLHGLLADMEELVDGKGDGVVAVKRGRLAGVDDTIVLPFGHLSCTGDEQDAEAVREAVLARLH